MSQFANGGHMEGTAMWSPVGQPPPPTVAMEAHILPEPWTPDISYTRDFQRLFKQWKSFLIGSPCETPDIKTHIR